MPPWYRNEQFWQSLFPFLFPAQRLTQATLEAQQIIDLTSPQGYEVLDLACGPGRHSIALARQGFRVTGVDASEFLLGKAQQEASRAGVEITWMREDMRVFSRPMAFDLIINMYTSFGYFENRNDDRLVLRNIHRNLKPGGKVVLDMIGKERLAAIFLSSNVDALDNGSLLVQRRKIVDDWTRIKQEWILIEGGNARSFNVEHTIYSGQELSDRLYAAGFGEVSLFGNLEGAPYDRHAQRLVAVAAK